MDAADGAQRDRRDLGIPESASVRIARSRHEVLLGISGDARGWWYKTDSTPGAQSKPECVRRKMGSIGEGGMFIETNLVRRSLAATRPDRFHFADRVSLPPLEAGYLAHRLSYLMRRSVDLRCASPARRDGPAVTRTLRYGT